MNVPKPEIKLSAPEYFSRYPASTALSFFLISLSPVLFPINVVFSLFSLSVGILLHAYIIVLEEHGNEKEVMINPPDVKYEGRKRQENNVITSFT